MVKDNITNKTTPEIIDQDTSYTCGSYFKYIREQKNINLNKVSEDINVIKDILDNIEKDNYNKLPPPVYLKGIIKKYAQYLNINQDFIFTLYSKSNGRKLSSGSNDFLPQNRFEVKRLHFLKLITKVIGRLLEYLLILIISAYIIFEISEFILPAKITITYPPDNFTTNQSNIEISGIAKRTKILYFQDREIALDNNNQFKEEIVLKPGVNVFQFKAVNALGKNTLLERKIMYYSE